jgi:NADH-quinone oxidoreductase subunit H
MVTQLQGLPGLQELINSVLKIITSRTFLEIVVFPGFLNVLLSAAFLTWLERKVIARVQLRIGPLYAGMWGILQPIADGVKLLFKEMILPELADAKLLMLCALGLMMLAAAPIVAIPFGEGLVIANMDVGLVFVFAVLSLFPSVVLLIGWGSNSKYSFLGGLRSLFQQVAYEIPMWLSVLGIVMLTGTLNLTEIVRAQQKVWFVIPQILGFAAFFTAALAELERTPFDLPEAETELVMGWMTELSGAAFMVGFLAMYTKLYVMSALITTLFLGGWSGPSIVPEPLWVVLKTFLVAGVIVIIRGTFPRVRVDILLRTGWTRLLLLALANVFVTVIMIWLGFGWVWRV